MNYLGQSYSFLINPQVKEISNLEHIVKYIYNLFGKPHNLFGKTQLMLYTNKGIQDVQFLIKRDNYKNK